MRFVAVLVDPARPANVGAAARALANFGGELRVVRGDHALAGGSGHDEASAVAWNAKHVLDSAARFGTLREAIADSALSVATSSRASGGLTFDQLREEAARLPGDAVLAVVFGSEESGLSNDEMDACRARLCIPTLDEQPSLNLAQSVVVVAHELSRVRPRPATAEPPAREEDLARLFDRARELLLDAGFLNRQAPEHVLGELRRLLSRARPTAREVTLLQGLVAQLRWAQRHLPREPGDSKLTE